MSRLRFTPLGGVDEVGRNCFLYSDTENKKSIVIDAGELIVRKNVRGRTRNIIPNIDLLEKLLLGNNTLGIFLTHGHMDHINSASLIAVRCGLSVFLPLTALHFLRKQCRDRAFVKADEKTPRSIDRRGEKFEGIVDWHLVKELPANLQHKHGFSEKIDCIDSTKRYRFGDYEVTPFLVNHSIPDTYGFLFEGNGQRIVHLPDHKLNSFTLQERNDFENTLRRLAYPRVDLLVTEALGSGISGFVPFESEVIDSVQEELTNALNIKERVFITLFSSNIRRLRKLYDVVLDLTGEPPAFLGSSMRYVSRFLGLKFSKLEDARVIFLTGCQAEEGEGHASALVRLNKNDIIGKADAVIFSSRSIPGSEDDLRKLISDLARKGALVIIHNGELKKLNLPKNCGENVYEALTHVSGHGFAEDKRFVLQILKPKVVVPYHAEKYDVEAFKALVPLGTECRIVQNGETLEI